MDAQDMLEAARREAERVGGERASTRHALVDGYDPDTYAVRVRFQPENALSGWLPLLTPRAGNGAGIYAPPNIGDQVVVSFQEDDYEAGVVLGALYSTEDKPLAVPAGEVWIVHEDGAQVRISPGRLALSVAGVSLVITSAGVAITGGTVTHEGKNIGATHRHAGVQTGGGQTAVPV